MTSFDTSGLSTDELRAALAAREQADAGQPAAPPPPATSPFPTIPSGVQAPPAMGSPVPPAPAPVGVDPTMLAQLNAQIAEMQSRLSALTMGGLPAPEPRFHSIFDLFRELAQRTLGADVLHEFLATVNRLDEDYDTGEPVAPAPAPAAAAAPPPGA